MTKHYPKMSLAAFAHKFKPEIPFGAVLALEVALVMRIYAINFGVIQFGDPDEGAYLGVARLLNHGYAYGQFFFDQFPLFPQLLALAFRTGGDNVSSARAMILIFAALGLVAIALLTRTAGTRAAALLAVGLTALHPFYVTFSRYTMSEVPSIALALWALVVVSPFGQPSSRWRLALAAMLLTASVLIKPLAIGLVFPLFAWVVWTRIERGESRIKVHWRPLLVDGIVFAGVCLVTALPFLGLHLGNEFRETVVFHEQELNARGPEFQLGLNGLGKFLQDSVGWLGLFGLGVAALTRRAPLFLLPLLAGNLITLALVLQLPPFSHHYTLLVPTLSIVAALGLEQGARELYNAGRALPAWRREAERYPVRLRVLGLAAAAVVAFILTCVSAPQVVAQDRAILERARRNDDAVVTFLAQHTHPNDFVLSDDPIVVYLAGCLLPPSGINLAYVSTFEIDRSAFARLSQTMQVFPVQAVVVTGEYHRNPKLIHWLEATFPVQYEVDGGSAALSAKFFLMPPK